MSINQLNDAVAYLLDNGYAYWYGKNRLKLTTKFYEAAFGGTTAVVAIPPLKVSWQDRYIDFIRKANVPTRMEDTRGGYYATNKYSDGGMKAFRKMVEEGTKEDILVESTRLYYRSGVRLKVAIGRYIEEGLWRTDYDAYMTNMEAGSIAELEKQQLNDGSHTSWTVG